MEKSDAHPLSGIMEPAIEESNICPSSSPLPSPRRRALGMKGRDNVLNSFSSHRYLREHEQMLWLGKYQSHSYIARSAVSSGASSGLLIKEKAISQRVSYLDSVPGTPDSSSQPMPARAWRALRDYRQAGSSGTQTPTSFA